MALVPAKCTNCGAALQVDNAKDAAICQHCGSAFIVEKAINHYHVHNTITADTVNVYTAAADFVIRAGVLEKYNGAETDVVIPAGVKIIGEKAFEGCIGLTSVVIPEGVVEIGSSAFSGCTNLASIVIPEGITSISCGVFCRCSKLSSISLPSSLITIGDHAFSGCAALQNITIPANVATVGFFAFSECTELQRMTLLGTSTKFLTPDNMNSFQGSWKLAQIICPDVIKLIVSSALAFRGTEWSGRHKAGHCLYCGNSFKGLLKKVCKSCGRPKDY